MIGRAVFAGRRGLGLVMVTGLPVMVAALAPVLSSSRAGADEAVKPVEVMQLRIELASRLVRPGEEIRGSLLLRGSGGGEVRAPHPMVIQLDTRVEGEAPVSTQVTIASGESRAPFHVAASRVGMIALRASNPELRDAGTFVRCAPPPSPEESSGAQPKRPNPTSTTARSTPRLDPVTLGTEGTGSGPKKRKTATSGGSVRDRGATLREAPHLRTGGSGGGGANSIELELGATDAKGDRRPTAASPPPPTAVPPPPATATPPTKTLAEPGSDEKKADKEEPGTTTPRATAPDRANPSPAPRTFGIGYHDARPHVTLRLGPQRPVLADGKDALSVFAFLDRAAPTDVRLNVFSSMGVLDPRPLVIPRGASDGVTQLTGRDPGDVEVELLGVDPPATIDGDRKLKARFAAPVAALELKADPAAITLVETGKLTVRLKDTDGRSVATDGPRTVDLTLDRGHGAITVERITVAAGQSEASTTFEPTWPGPVGFSATSTSLLSQSATLRVGWPFGLLALSLAGGLVGGALAMLRTRRQHVRRVLTGGVTGFVLYWAFVVGLLPLLRRTLVLNPLSVFALSTLGGWMGTEVFALLLRKLGLIDKPARRGGEGGGGGASSETKAADKPDKDSKPEHPRAVGE